MLFFTYNGYSKPCLNGIKPNKVLVENDSSSYMKFKYEDSTLTQIIKIKYIDKHKIMFILKSKNESELSKISGVAVSKSGDYEIDEDDKGYAYPAVQYIYNKDCWLSIRIDAKTRERLQINEGNCKHQREKSTPFGSKGILHKVK